MSGVLQLTALAWSALMVLVVVVVAGIYPLVRPHLLTLGPATRAQVLTWMALSPWLVATVLTLACFLPPLAERAMGIADDCTHHATLHAHFCWTHRSARVGLSGWLVSAAILLPSWAVTIYEGVRLGRAWMGAERLARTSTATCLAFTVGLVRPRIVVGAALAAELTDEQLDAVLSHERAHIDRRDNLRKVVAMLLSRTHHPRVRRALLADLRLACEEACDRRAAIEVEDPMVVASSIVAVERLTSGFGVLPDTASAFGANLVEARVQALLQWDEGHSDDERPLRWWLLGGLASALVLSIPLHDVIEDAVSIVGC